MTLPDRLAMLLAQASETGQEVCIRAFFEELLTAQVAVPDRNQSHQLSYSPSYPNDLVTMLGVQDGEDIVVPIFSSAELIQAWCGLPLTFTTQPTGRLLQAIPQGWKIELNPGSEYSKELTPWEIEQLKKGPSAISELIEDLTETPHRTISNFSLLPVEEDELQQLKGDLTNEASKLASIVALYLVREAGTNEELSKPKDRLFLGVLANCNSSNELEQLKAHLESVAKKTLIGQEEITVAIGADISSLALSMFAKFKPFYQTKPNSWVKSLFNKFT